MKPQRNYLEVESTLVGEDVKMGIDLSSMPHLMNVLTDLYEDRELACIREYSTNAWDANREAGNDHPIRVSLPSALRPLLVIEDDGPGLDADDIRRIYSQYGASTKRDSDDAVGMLGLGCKSALTYADQFTLVSVKDGTRTTVSISRDDAGSGVMKILAQDPTADGNGTAVQIPARRDNSFPEKAEKFYRFWAAGDVVVDGKAPDPLGGLQLSPDLHVLDDEPNDWIVMGNVPYPTTLNIYDHGINYGRRYGGQAVVARVPIGAVNFTPSRESLMDTEQTEQTQSQIRGDFARLAADGVQKAVDAAPDKTAALLAYVEANAALPSQYRVEPTDVTYQSLTLPDFGNQQYGNRIHSSGHKHGLTVGPVDLATAASALWVTEYENDHWTGANRTKLQAYMERHLPDQENSQRPIVIVADKKVPHRLWVPEANIVNWPTVRKWQPPRDPNAPKAAKRVTGSYNGYSPGASYVGEHAATDLPRDATLFYAVCRKYEGGGFWKRLTGLREGKATWLMLLPQTRLAKFQRDFPKAQEVRAFVKSHAKNKLARMTKDELIAARYQGTRYVGLFKDLPLHDQQDPELQQVIRWAQAAAVTKDGEVGTLIQKYGLEWPAKSKTDLFGAVAERYPLLEAVTYKANVNDLTLYTNAAYEAARKE